MYFIYLKSSGAISPPVKYGKPDHRTIYKEADCGLGSGIKWDNVDVFYFPDEEVPDDFQGAAPLGKYYVDGNKIKENMDWVEPEEE